MMLDIAKKHKLDYILVDFGPSCSIMNKVFLMSCDYILPPIFAEKYSFDTMEIFLKTLFPEWINWADSIRSNQSQLVSDKNDSITSYLFKKTNPKILPFFFTSFKIYKEKEKANLNLNAKAILQTKPTFWLTQLERALQDSNISSIVRNHFVDGGLVLPIIRFLGNALATSQQLSIPLPLIEREDLINEKNRDWIITRRDEVRNNFGEFVDSLDRLQSDDYNF